MMIVADTNTFLAVALQEPERSDIISITTGHEIIAPNVLPFEVGNALTAMVKRGALHREEVTRVWNAICNIPVELQGVQIRDALEIAVELDIYAYDAYFLECCRSANAPLLTLDRGLNHAAKAIHIETLWEIQS